MRQIQLSKLPFISRLNKLKAQDVLVWRLRIRMSQNIYHKSKRLSNQRRIRRYLICILESALIKYISQRCLVIIIWIIESQIIMAISLQNKKQLRNMSQTSSLGHLQIQCKQNQPSLKTTQCKLVMIQDDISAISFTSKAYIQPKTTITLRVCSFISQSMLQNLINKTYNLLAVSQRHCLKDTIITFDVYEFMMALYDVIIYIKYLITEFKQNRKMTRFIKQNSYQDNVYIEFKFQSSLRKYQNKPTKRIKCDFTCQHCVNHHHLRKHQTSPVAQCNNNALSKSKKKNRFKSPSEGPSANSLISNRTIKLSQNKSSRFPSLNKSKLQKKIYQQLQKNKINPAKLNSNQSYNQEIQQQVFLNDFEPAESMNLEKEQEFNNFDYIEIVNNQQDKNDSDPNLLLQPSKQNILAQQQNIQQLQAKLTNIHKQVSDLLQSHVQNGISLININKIQQQELIKQIDQIQLQQPQKIELQNNQGQQNNDLLYYLPRIQKQTSIMVQQEHKMEDNFDEKVDNYQAKQHLRPIVQKSCQIYQENHSVQIESISLSNPSGLNNEAFMQLPNEQTQQSAQTIEQTQKYKDTHRIYPISQTFSIIEDNQSSQYKQTKLSASFLNISPQNYKHPSDQENMLLHIKEDHEASNLTQKQELTNSQELGSKCFVFQGGRIYIDAFNKRSYISVRVFNKLVRRYPKIDELLQLLMQQRPYLQSKRDQIREQLQQYIVQNLNA